MLRPLLTTILLGLSAAAFAASPEDQARKLSEMISNAQRTAGGFLQHERASAVARSLQEQSPLGRAASGIADPEMAAEWEAVRRGLGIKDDGQFYIFASFSMPDSLIRSYALDAARAGGVLVFRGIEEGSDLRTFFTKRLSLIVRPGLAAAPIQIDPRLFDAYSIEHVPTLVLTKANEGGIDDLCQSVTVEHVETTDGQRVPYQRCAARHEQTFWKIAGSVTALYALEEFAALGASEAQPFMDALREAGATSAPEQAELSADQWGALADALMRRNNVLLGPR